jgi:DNA repair protein RadC
MSMHDGHRQRIKNRFRMEGLDHFDEIYVLELLLCYCVPRKDTKPLAHALLEHFGSLTQVLEAPVEELEKVPGVGENISTFLTLTTAVSRYYLVHRSAPDAILDSTVKCGRYLMPFFHGRRNETVFLLCLDAKCKVISCREVGEGSVNSAAIPVRKIVEMALAANATTAVLAHNHPSGLALPSIEDIQATKRIAKALYSVEVILADHVIVSDDDFVSLAESGHYRADDIRIEML